MGQVVLIVGEPGLGKSRLIHTLKLHVEEETAASPKSMAASVGGASVTRATSGRPVIEWRSSPHYRNTSFYPAIAFFEQFLGSHLRRAPAALRPACPPSAVSRTGAVGGSWGVRLTPVIAAR
jgi:hypothetical protein